MNPAGLAILASILGLNFLGRQKKNKKGFWAENPAGTATSGYVPIPTIQSPTAIPPSPTPTLAPNVQLSDEQMAALVGKHFNKPPIEKDLTLEDLQKKLVQTFKRESSSRTGAYHINRPSIPTGLSGDGGYINSSATPEWWKGQRKQFPSIDVGLTQLHTAPAMNDYLAKKGYTYFDLLHNADKNVEVASDLYYGRIPYTAPGIQNWVAAKLLGFTK
jgi:hypothetical protein